MTVRGKHFSLVNMVGTLKVETEQQKLVFFRDNSANAKAHHSQKSFCLSSQDSVLPDSGKLLSGLKKLWPETKKHAKE